MPKAVTVTLNPAIDRTIVLDSLVRGRLNRSRIVRVDPGGKGINVARVARRLGVDVRAAGLLPAGGGELIKSCLEHENIPFEFVEAPGEVRCNLKIVEADGAQTEINEPGPEAPAAAGGKVLKGLATMVEPGDVVVLAGSLPQGLEPDFYARLVDVLNARGVSTILDTDGEPLRFGVYARPALVKPNRHEASELLGRALDDMQSVLLAAEDIRSMGAKMTVISLGSEGAILVSPQKRLWAAAPSVEVKGTVGSGDAMVAGLVWGMLHGSDPETMLKLATAAGTASASTLGTAGCSAEDIRGFERRVAIQSF
ncbi:MAG: 1-phosphofructokinase [Ignavibacteriales bacterium]